MKTMTVKETLTRAQTAFRIGDYVQVEKLLLKVIDVKPDLAPAHNMLGSVYEKLSDYGKAFKEFKKAIELKEDYSEAYNNLGVTLKSMERFEEAISVFKKALEFAPNRADIHYNIGNTFKRLKNYPEAVESFEKARELDPQFVPTYNNLGTIYDQLDKYEEAVSIYRKGLQADFNQPRIHYNLGIVLEKTGRLREAQIEYEQTLKVEPGWVEALNNLGVVLQKQGKQNEAIKVFQEILKIDPRNLPVRNNLGVVYSNLGRNEEAIQFYRDALKINPGYFKAVSNLGSVFESGGHYSEALEEFEKLVKLNPENFETRFRLAGVYLYLERYEEAVLLFKKILEIDPNHKESLRALAIIYQKLGKREEAEECYRALMKIDPESRSYHLDLAMVARDQEDYKTVENEVKQYLEKSPDDDRARLLLGESYYHRSLYKHASQIFEDLLKTKPEYREAYDYLAKTYRKTGETESAIATLEKVMTLEGTSSDSKDLDKLRNTLDEYEEAISEYEPNYRDEWNRNLRLLKGLGGGQEGETEEAFDAAGVEAADLDADSLIMEEDEVPIINIGGMEPVLSIEEEEEELNLTEIEEDLGEPEKTVIEIKDERAPSLMNLLKDQDLYKENHDWQGFQLPPGLKEALSSKADGSGVFVPEGGGFIPEGGVFVPEGDGGYVPTGEGGERAGTPVGVGGAGKPGLTPEGESVIAESLKESVKAQQEMVAELTDDLKDVTRQLKERSQFIPVPIPPAAPQLPQPLQSVPQVPPASRPEEEGFPRFEADTAEAESAFPPVEEEGAFEPETPEEPDELKGKEFGNLPELETAEETEKESAEAQLEELAEEGVFIPAGGVFIPAGGEGGNVPAGGVFIPEGEGGEGEPETVSSPPEAGLENPAELFEYLERLTQFLPEQQKTNYLQSDARLKIQYLKARLQGREGIRNKIEKKFHPEAARPVLSAQKIRSVFSNIRDLTSFHPDISLGDRIRQKIEKIIQKIRR